MRMRLKWKKNPQFPKRRGEYLMKVHDGTGGWIERRATVEEAHLIAIINKLNARRPPEEQITCP